MLDLIDLGDKNKMKSPHNLGLPTEEVPSLATERPALVTSLGRTFSAGKVFLAPYYLDKGGLENA